MIIERTKEILGKTKDLKTRLILLLLAIAFIRGAIYAVITPPWQAPDEPFHYEYIQELAKKYNLAPTKTDLSTQSEIIASMARWDFWRFQNQTTPQPLPWGFDAIPFFSTIRYLERPPVYYYLNLPLYWFVSGQSLDIRVYSLRFNNVIISILLVLMVYLIANEIFPDNIFITFGAPLMVALLPMFTFLTGSINSDNLANLFFSIFLYLSIKILKEGLSLWRILEICLIFLLSLTTKRTTIAEIPLLLILPVFYLFRAPFSNRQVLFRRLGLLGLELGILILVGLQIWKSTPTKAYLRRILGVHITISEIGLKLTSFIFFPAKYDLVFESLRKAFESFWANFGWMNIPVNPTYYKVLFFVVVTSFIGLVVFLSRVLRKKEFVDRWQKQSLLFLFISISLVGLIALARSTVYEFIPLQGRYIFPAIAPMGLFFVLGIQSLVPQRHQKFAFILLAVSLFLFDAASLFGYLIPIFYNW